MTMPANNRRVVQMLWLAAGLLFVFALLHSMTTPSQAKEWATSKVGNLVQNIPGTRPSLREFMATAEAVWEKTVRQRHDMIAADYGDASLMPL